MQKRTAAKVADLLGLAEAWLEGGRPRKLPGKPRAEAIIYGLPSKATMRNFYLIEKVSLVGAFRAARIEQGYTRYVQEIAEAELANMRFPQYKCYGGLQWIDNIQYDTRELLRDIRAARKRIEKAYLS